MEQLKTFCISLKNNIISENLSKECLESGKKFKWKIIQFEATSIEDVNNEIWKKFNVIPSKDNKFQKRIGAQGCYLSHFRLWNICIDLNEPIIILEHDAIVSNIFPNIETE